MQTTLRVDAAPVMRKLDRLADTLTRGTDPRMQAAHRTAGGQYLWFIRQRFTSASSGDGTWQPLAPSTVRQKGAPVPILRETGRLFRSLTPGHPDNVFRVSRNGVRVGTRVPYAEFHQQGAGHLPKREIMVTPDEPTLKRIAATYSKAFRQAVEAGLRK